MPFMFATPIKKRWEAILPHKHDNRENLHLSFVWLSHLQPLVLDSRTNHHIVSSLLFCGSCHLFMTTHRRFKFKNFKSSIIVRSLRRISVGEASLSSLVFHHFIDTMWFQMVRFLLMEPAKQGSSFRLGTVPWIFGDLFQTFYTFSPTTKASVMTLSIWRCCAGSVSQMCT
jgi:hypothetical protein